LRLELTEAEYNLCQILGRMRSLISRGTGVKDAKMGKQDGSEADVMGAVAEYAFAKKFNCFPDFAPEARSGSYDGILKGNRYDIKSSQYPNARLLSTMKVNPDVDFYVLAIVDGRSVDIKGWAWKRDLIKEENIKDLGHGKGYCLDQSRLKPFNVT